MINDGSDFPNTLSSLMEPTQEAINQMLYDVPQEYAKSLITYYELQVEEDDIQGGYLPFDKYCDAINFFCDVAQFTHEQGIRFIGLVQQIRDARNE